MVMVLRIAVVLLMLFLLPLVAVEEPPAVASPQVLSAEKIEFHGTLNGKPYWLRLMPADKKFAGMRVMELLYTPKAKEELAGAHMVDHPTLLLDAQLNIRAWREGRGVHQTGLGGIIYRTDKDPAQYDIQREIDDSKGSPAIDHRSKEGAPAWDLEIAPILLAITAQKTDAVIETRIIDFFGSTFKQDLKLRCAGEHCHVGQQDWTVKRDDKGRIKQLLDAENKVIFEVKGWL